MWMESYADIIILIVACEALVHLWFHAAPLQPLRSGLIKVTPFLYSKAQHNHLVECKYCTSLWIGVILLIGYTLFYTVTVWVSSGLVIHRLSNHLHLIFSFIRDMQLDIRVKRR